MSKYTTEVRYICEVNAGLTQSEGYKSINQIITDSMDKIFDFDYPIFDEAYRPVLQRKILKHYYTREIGAETVGLWKHFLDMKMNEIMPYYNKMYLLETLNFNPLYDVDVTTTRDTTGHENSLSTTTSNDRTTMSDTIQHRGTDTTARTSEDDGTDSTSRTSQLSGTDNSNKATTDGGSERVSGSDIKKNTRWDIYSDTPQGTLQNVQNEAYLTNARKITDDGTGSTVDSTTTFGKTVNETGSMTYGKKDTTTESTNYGKTNETNESVNYGKNINETGNKVFTANGTAKSDTGTTENYIQRVYGKTPGASYGRLIQEYRESLINIDMLIINELSELFMNLW